MVERVRSRVWEGRGTRGGGVGVQGWGCVLRLAAETVFVCVWGGGGGARGASHLPRDITRVFII